MKRFFALALAALALMFTPNLLATPAQAQDYPYYADGSYASEQTGDYQYYVLDCVPDYDGILTNEWVWSEYDGSYPCPTYVVGLYYQPYWWLHVNDRGWWANHRWPYHGFHHWWHDGYVFNHGRPGHGPVVHPHTYHPHDHDHH